MLHRSITRLALTLLVSSVVVAPGAISPIPSRVLSTASASQSLNDAIRFRMAFGLNADATYVSQVMANPAASSAAYGTVLLPSEQAELDARLVVQRQLSALEDYVAAHPDMFAGMWIDQPHGGAVVLQLSDGASTLPVEAARLVPSGATIHIQSVRNSHAALEVLAASISSDMNSLQASGIHVVRVSVDVPKNLVEVGVDGLTRADEAALIARYGWQLEILSAVPLQ